MVRVVVSDPESGKAYQVEPEESQFRDLIGLTIGDRFSGERIGLSGYELQVMGGSDGEGFPMRSDVRGESRVRGLFSGGTGYRPKEKGLNRRKTVRGNRVSAQTEQLNTKVVEWGQESIEKALGLESSVEGLEEGEESEGAED